MTRRININSDITTILLDKESKKIIEKYSINLSDWVRKILRAYDTDPKYFAERINISHKTKDLKAAYIK